jgi:hypothetical protein
LAGFGWRASKKPCLDLNLQQIVSITLLSNNTEQNFAPAFVNKSFNTSNQLDYHHGGVRSSRHHATFYLGIVVKASCTCHFRQNSLLSWR